MHEDTGDVLIFIQNKIGDRGCFGEPELFVHLLGSFVGFEDLESDKRKIGHHFLRLLDDCLTQLVSDTFSTVLFGYGYAKDTQVFAPFSGILVSCDIC